MDMVEVDRELFVTCRLCLEDFGQYQIVPSVQKQIKYCFDIDVDPFDGLPQLICVKCKQILINFFAIKETLCEKQENLRNQIHKKITNIRDERDTGIQPQQDAVSSSQLIPEVTQSKKSTTKSKRKRNSTESQVSLDSLNLRKKKKIVNNNIIWHDISYQKNYMCRICTKTNGWPSVNSVSGHTRVHANIKANYPDIFKKNCSVLLKKIDDKPNLTGSHQIVVHSAKRITESVNSLYYVKYVKQTSNDSETESDSQHSQSSDSEEEILVRPKQRRRQLLSRSSNDTVVLDSNKAVSDTENDNKTPPPQTEALAQSYQCINIDDSSDSDAERSRVELTLKPKQPIEAKLGDYKIIQGIINMCVNAYLRKNETVEKSDKHMTSESQLKRKVLSIGRKIINRQGVNLTGLLRYLEHKNLDIVWVTKALQNSNSKDSNYIRIITKLRDEKVIDDNLGWEPVTEFNLVPVVGPDSPLRVSQQTPPVTQNLCNIQSQSHDIAVLSPCNPPDAMNKLLNANPVPNPKQLPRKLGQAGESRLNKVVNETCESFQNVEDNGSMPIITSAQSLAEPSCSSTSELTTLNVDRAPRIKVKPVTELMSERTLQSLRMENSTCITTSSMALNNNGSSQVSSSVGNINNLVLSQPDNTNNMVLNQSVWPVQNQVTNLYLPSIQLVPITCLDVTPANNQFQTTLVNKGKTTNRSNNKEEYVLLHTVELPNTKTDSPFKYFKKLLTMYNLSLIDPHEILPGGFVCLIKFKVQFKQEPIDEPVVLCLSLFCSKNKFCFTVRDRNQINIDVNKISPNWQWEILNVFRGDVVDKLLQNAQKHSQETRDYTNQFLCLLKSIKFTKLS